MGDKLTRRAVDAWLKTSAEGQWLWCGELRGFGIHRRRGVKGAFVAQFRVGRGRLAKRRRVVLGEYPTMTPEEARMLAADHIKAGWKGTDPVAEKRAAQAIAVRRQDTFETLFDTFHEGRKYRLRASSATLYRSAWERLILPEFGPRSVSTIKRSEVAALMDRVGVASGTSAADRVYFELGRFFDWFASRDDDFRSPLVRSMKRHAPGDGARPMTDDELRVFWTACENAGLAGASGRFCLLTATRRAETLDASWSEHSGADLWTIPAARYKTHREHVVPLSRMALLVLASVEHASRFIFSRTGSPPHATTYWNAIRAAGCPRGDGISWHSLRKTARTLMARAGVRADHAERALGHVQGEMERIYDRHTYLLEKRAAFEALAAEIARVIDGRSIDNVISLGRSAQS